VKLPDTNVLLHAVNRDMAQHPRAHAWLRAAFSGAAGVGMAWVALLGFIRLSTRPGILARPLSIEDAMRAAHYWLDHPRTQILHPTPRHGLLLGRLLTGAVTAGNLSADAHLAALAIEHGATLGSFDRDFERFAGLSFELLT
jgi:uncharacterized protein